MGVVRSKRIRLSKPKATRLFISEGGYVTRSAVERRILEKDKPLTALGQVVLVRPPVRTAKERRMAIQKAVRELKQAHEA